MTRDSRPPRPARKKGAGASKVGKVRLDDQKKRTSSSRDWLLRQLNDPYVAKAQALGYRSRAAFKLIEINEKYRFLKPGMTVIDLGAAPGGWTQVVAEKLKVGMSRGASSPSQVIAVDLCEISPLAGVTMLTADFTQESAVQAILANLSGGVDVLLSDMAAPACGMADVDHIRIMNLVEAAYGFACTVLKPGGTFVAKVLRGGTERNLLNQLKKSFGKVHHFKPPSSRRDSAEMYVVAQGFRQKGGSKEIKT